MYNGIGLTTARGSGTNGYVQRNMAFVRNRKEKVDYKTESDFSKSDTLQSREPNTEILEHERKRKIELKCMELRELMEDQGYEASAIEPKVNAFRVKLIEKDKTEKPQVQLDESGRVIVSGTHQIAAASQDRNRKLRDAFGLSADFVDGSSLDPLRKQKEMDKKNAERKYAIIKDPEEIPKASVNVKRKPKHGGPTESENHLEKKTTKRNNQQPPKGDELPQHPQKQGVRITERKKGDNIEENSTAVFRKAENGGKGRKRRRSHSTDESSSSEAEIRPSRSRRNESSREERTGQSRERNVDRRDLTARHESQQHRSTGKNHDSLHESRRKPLKRMSTSTSPVRPPTSRRNHVSSSSSDSSQPSRSPKSKRNMRRSSRTPEKRNRSPYSSKRQNKQRRSSRSYSPDPEQRSSRIRRRRSRS